MFTSREFNKAVPLNTGVVFEIIGISQKGFTMFIENQDAAKTIVYSMEDSPDGVTWTTIVFTNGGDSNQFSLSHGNTHNVKVISTAPHVRLKASGDAPAGFKLSFYQPSANDSTPLTITNA